ncbi:actin cytoskeleton-regulatory complex protein pan1-like [Rosa chinensis]|uniref:actin cytoskeleton-regulatory complex protein pan1-like n=1 Tax=Rosa chinensis TaxID=74649 RepID=UPI000D090231|nr:actin cytoskeleton-regulatory complex protein pan1-like [Rosa chinensis]
MEVDKVQKGDDTRNNHTKPVRRKALACRIKFPSTRVKRQKHKEVEQDREEEEDEENEEAEDEKDKEEQDGVEPDNEEEEEEEKNDGARNSGKDQKQSYCQYRCNMIAFHDVLHKVYEQLNREEKMRLKAELKKTPFWNLIEAYDKGLMTKNTTAKSDREMHRLVQCYKPALKKFKFGNKLAEISVSDVHYILGLPNQKSALTVPNPIDDPKKPTDHPLVQRFFANDRRIKKARIMSCIDEQLREKAPGWIENMTKLLLLHLFITLLFASSGSTLGWSFVKCITDIETMRRYNWARAVRDYLLLCLQAATTGKARQISGCVALIPYWICERSTMLVEIKGREAMTPGCVKWSLPQFTKELQKMQVDDIEIDNAVADNNRSKHGKENSDDDFENPPSKHAATAQAKGQKRQREEKKATVAAKKPAKKRVAEKRAKSKENKISNEGATAPAEKEKRRNEEETADNESEGFEDEHEDMTLRDWVDMNSMNFAKKIDENKGEEGMQTKTTSGVNVNDMDLGATEEEEDAADGIRDDFSFDTGFGGQENETNFVDQDRDGTEGAEPDQMQRNEKAATEVDHDRHGTDGGEPDQMERNEKAAIEVDQDRDGTEGGEPDRMERNERAATEADDVERNRKAATEADDVERNRKAATEADANFMDQTLKSIIEEIVNEATRKEKAATEANEAARKEKAATEAGANIADQILHNIVEEIVNEEYKSRNDPVWFDEWEALLQSEYDEFGYPSTDEEQINTVEHWQDVAMLKQDMAGSAIESCKRKQAYIERLWDEKEEVSKKYKKLKTKLKKKQEELRKWRNKCKQLMMIVQRVEKDEEANEDVAATAAPAAPPAAAVPAHATAPATVPSHSTAPAAVPAHATAPSNEPRTRSAIKRIKERTDRKEKQLEGFEVQKPSKKQRKKSN